MRFTRPTRDFRAGVFFAAVTTAAGAAAASCSSDGEPVDGPPDNTPEAGAQTQDSGPREAAPRDSSPVDAAPLPILCSSSPCATSLTTTFGPNPSDRSGGFCALLKDGTVACWGANGSGQLGRGDEVGVNDSPTPARVLGVTDVVALDHTCAVTDNGDAYCWGTGPFLRDGSGAPSLERTPIKLSLPRVTSISVNPKTACASTSEGVTCWGSNENAQVGPLEEVPRDVPSAPHDVTIPPGSNVRALAIGAATFALRESGELLSWGATLPLGRVSSIAPDPHPLPLTLAGVSSIDVVAGSACATASGTGYCWGVVTPRSTDSPNRPPLLHALPIPLVTPEPIRTIATTSLYWTDEPGSPVVQPQRWCATGISGDVYCWGYNASGQAGDGTKNYAVDAVRVVGLPGPAAEVKTSLDATCALLTSGTIYCWGSDFYGELGTGKLKVPSLTPVQVILP